MLRPYAVALVAVSALALAGCRRTPPLTRAAAEFGVEAAPGEEAPAVELATMDGGRVSLASLRGRVVFVNFWATWCPPCRAEMPSMMALARELSAKYPGKFEMVAVSVDEGWPAVHKFFEEKPYLGSAAPLTVCLDGADQRATTAFYCAARGGCPAEYKFPESYVVDRSGKLVAYVVGPRDWSDPRARAYFEQLLQ
jgi:thiol-disulfide isomerase/thioredoxin